MLPNPRNECVNGVFPTKIDEIVIIYAVLVAVLVIIYAVQVFPGDLIAM